jgi:drug/metabolite transporter (DMT)-like permease
VLLLKQPLPPGFLGALALSIVGVVIMVGPDVWQHFSTSTGVALGLLAGMAYAVYLVITERERRTMDTLSFMTVSSTVGAACLLLWCLLTNTPITGFSTTSWLALIGLGLISCYSLH